ncbi:hypothetical protein [Flavobacterium sp. S87F.05.LMB.W.Kidney.N]|uniref:hypothetical protein n=1 Tax=Flavobacterium sp. S87F.05.LMB.W.Kidney.N TaxID=1278758 RepID=UPI0010649C3A|nr:hypothetical protein [Flavobacterium sp. S87F.05.LMB.W.Kidney.N]TDX09724.1 hypothetical protein EDB96_3311 [Flavobacterium sp. S87F.05.LMB.W.Kidney.N]
MPSESKLEYKYEKFWVKDGFLLVFYIFLFDELKNDNKYLIELKKELVQNIDNIFIDMFAFLDFNEFIISDEIKKYFNKSYRKHNFKNGRRNQLFFTKKFRGNIISGQNLSFRKFGL